MSLGGNLVKNHLAEVETVECSSYGTAIVNTGIKMEQIKMRDTKQHFCTEVQAAVAVKIRKDCLYSNVE